MKTGIFIIIMAFIKKCFKIKSRTAHMHGFAYDLDFLLYCKAVSGNLAMGGCVVEHNGRCTGKTTRAIHISALTRRPILVFNRANAEILKRQAREIGLHIPEPLSWRTPPDKIRGLKIKGLIIDEAQRVLDEVLRERYHIVEEGYYIFGDRCVTDWRRQNENY